MRALVQSHVANTAAQLEGLPLEEEARIDPGTMIEARQKVAEGSNRVAEGTIQMAYAAWLG